MLFGPQVAFVDDIESEIRPLKTVLQALNTGTVFFDATPDRNMFPEKPLDTVKLLFLDLYYKPQFDAMLSAQWVQSIIVPNTRYSLVIWSKDTHQIDELLEILDRIELVPTYVVAWQKTNFDLQKHKFDEMIGKLILDISEEELLEEDILFGEILELSEDGGVIINCRLNDEQPTFQVRRFDRSLLAQIKNIGVGIYVRIHIYTKPGSRLIDIFEEKIDKSALFEQPDFFKGLEGNSFFIQG